MGKKNRARARRAIEAEVVKTTTTVVKEEPTLNIVFIYEFLNVHSIQKDIWGSSKSGKPYVLEGYELMANKDYELYIKRKIAERTIGKLYELTDEQLKETDEYMGTKRSRVYLEVGNKTVVTYMENK